jgi:hypothetical protein
LAKGIPQGAPPRDRDKERRAEEALLALLLAFFGRRAPVVAHRLLRALPPSAGGTAPIPDLAADDIDAALLTALPGIDWAHELSGPIAEALAPVYADGLRGGARAIREALAAHPGAPAPPPSPAEPRPIVPRPHPASPPAEAASLGAEADPDERLSVQWAREHAAKLVRSIEENTRDMIRGHVVAALREGLGAEELAARLRQSPGFDKARATRIARTELVTSFNHGNLAAYHASGVVWGKSWLTDGNPCLLCIANAAEGPIPLGRAFVGGVQAPTQHPNCECAIVPVIEPPARH